MWGVSSFNGTLVVLVFFLVGNGGAALWKLTTYVLAGLFGYGIKLGVTMCGVCEALCVEVNIQ